MAKRFGSGTRAALIASVVFAVGLSAVVMRRDGERPAPQSSDPITVAWDRVHLFPGDPKAWADLGDAALAAGEPAAAEHAYLTAIRMGGDNGLAYARLGFLSYEGGEDDRALAMLLEARRRGASVPMLDFTIDVLEHKKVTPAEIPEKALDRPSDAGVEESDANEIDASEPEPIPEPAPEAHVVPVAPRVPEHDGICSIPAERSDGGRTYALTTIVHGRPALMIIDTGASITVVTTELASAAGLPMDDSHVVRAITANGRVDFATGIADRIELAGRVTESVRVAVCADCIGGIADGLLGLDLVAAFGLRLDLANETIRFADCE